jgi:hypothetical protein
MRVMFDFRCDSGHVNEKLVDTETTEIDCPDCQLKARKIVTPVKIDAGDSWKETRKWVKRRESHMRATKA